MILILSNILLQYLIMLICYTLYPHNKVFKLPFQLATIYKKYRYASPKGCAYDYIVMFVAKIFSWESSHKGHILVLVFLIY